MSVSLASRDESAAYLPRKSTGLDVWLSAITVWYLTGLLAALGFSFGFYLVKPASSAVDQQRDVLDAFTWMDGKWYEQIATDGYRFDPNARSNVAFFPAYPLVARGLILTGIRVEVALIVVSNVSLLAALAMLGFYARAHYPDTPNELADSAMLAAAFFPTGCFFRLAYSESTFLLLAVLAMYAMLRRWPLWATAVIVGLATAARPVGVALLAPFATHIIRTSSSCSGRGRVRDSNDAMPDCRRWRVGLVCVRLTLNLPLACWGLAAFMAYQQLALGDAFAVFKAHDHWRIRAPVPWTEKAVALAELEPVRAVFHAKSPAFWASYDPHGIPWFSLQFANPLLFAGAVMLIAYGGWPYRMSLFLRERLGDGARSAWLSFEEVSLGLFMLLIPYVMRGYEMGMGSTGRFAAVVFPIYLVLGHVLARLPSSLRACLLALSAFFLSTFTALYSAHYVVF